MARLKLSLACWDYDRTRALADGSVRGRASTSSIALQPEGDFLPHAAETASSTSPRCRSRPTPALTREDRPFVAIPVFPSRFFRHSCIFVLGKSGIRRRAARGQAVGVPEYQMTAAVWIRGMLQTNTA
jgi:4,5-dihydroxyphthalate decarboxylase